MAAATMATLSVALASPSTAASAMCSRNSSSSSICSSLMGIVGALAAPAAETSMGGELLAGTPSALAMVPRAATTRVCWSCGIPAVTKAFWTPSLAAKVQRSATAVLRTTSAPKRRASGCCVDRFPPPTTALLLCSSAYTAVSSLNSACARLSSASALASAACWPARASPAFL